MQIKITILFVPIVCLATLSFQRFEKKERGPVPRVTLLKFEVPKGWPAPVYDFKSNPPTREGFDLGKKLFYDGRLSRDGNFPCASCHQQFAAFATFDHPLSH